MMAALAPFTAGLVGGGAAAGGAVAAGGVTAGAALMAGGAAGAAMIAAATNGLRLMMEVMKSPEFKEFMDFIRSKFIPSLDGGAGGGGAGSGGGSSTGDTNADEMARLREQLANLVKALRDFIETGDDLATSIAEIDEQARKLRDDLMNLDVGFDVSIRSMTDTINLILDSFDIPPVDLTKLGDLKAWLMSLPKDVRELIEPQIELLRKLFKAAGMDFDAILKLLSGLDTASMKQKAKAIEDFLKPIMEFINGPQAENPIKEVIEQYNEFVQALTDNSDALKKAGKDVDALLKQLTDALGKRLAEAVDKLIGQFDDLLPKTDDLASQLTAIRTQFGDAITELQKLLDAKIFVQGQGLSPDSFLYLITDPELRKKIEEQIKRLLGILPDALLTAARKFLEPVQDFIDRGQPQVDKIQGIFDEYDKMRQRVLLNAVALRAAGIDVDKVLTQLNDSLRSQLITAIKDMMSAFIERGLGAPGAIASLFKEFSELQEQLLTHAAVLRAAGVNVDQVMTQITNSFIAQIVKMRDELLAPITAAIERISSADLRPLTDFLGEIAGAKTLEDLARIRDAAISNIEERLSREQNAAREAADENIKLINLQKDEELKRLQEIQKVEEDGLRSQMSMLERLISLREEQARDQISAIEEQIKTTEDEIRARGAQLEQEKKSIEDITQAVQALREVARALREEADALLLSAESPLTPIQRFAEANRQFEETLARARSGDIEAAKALAGFGKGLISEAQAVFASSQPFQDIFLKVRSALLEVADLNEKQANLLGGSVSLEEKSLEELEQIRRELISQRDNLKTLLSIENRSEEIAKLTNDLGLTGKESLAALRQMRTELESKLAGLQDIFDQRAKEISAIFEAAIAKEQAALDLRLQELRDIAIAELEALRTALNDKFTALITATMNPAWVTTVVAALNNIALKIGAAPGPPPPGPPPPPPNLGPRVLNWPGFGSAPPPADLLRNFDFVRFSLPGGDFSPLVKAQHGGVFTRPTGVLLAEHGPEAVIPLRNSGGSILEIDYDRMKEVFAEALAERGERGQINIPIEVRTEDGETLVRRTIRRLADESSSGKIFIDARAVGKRRRS